MGSVGFQVLFINKVNFEEIIKNILIQVSEENGDRIDKNNINDFVEVKYIKNISNKKYLVGFEIGLDEYFSEEELRIFCEYLDSDSSCEFVIKFRDEYLFNSLKKYYKEIFNIEMRLREIFSYIFISTYETDCYSFLEFQKQRINPIYKGVKEEEIPSFLKNKYQNEFFYLTFSQYRQLKLPDIIKSGILVNLLADSKSLENLKENISKLGVLNLEKNDFLEFLNRISENLEPIETIRNCVAHNRDPIEDELNNYNVAKEKLEEDIEEFMNNLKEERDFGGPFTDIWEEGGGDEVDNNLRTFSFRGDVLNFYNEEANIEKFSIEKETMSYLRDKQGTWGLKFSENRGVVSAMLVDLKQMPRTHQELWHKYLID